MTGRRGPAPAARYLTVAEAAAELGISKAHVYELVYSGQLRHADFGTRSRRMIRICRGHLDGYIADSEATR